MKTQSYINAVVAAAVQKTKGREDGTLKETKSICSLILEKIKSLPPKLLLLLLLKRHKGKDGR